MLTDAKLRALKHRETLYRVTDSAGLAVEVPVNGAPRWRFRYRFDGRAKMLSLGTYPSVSLAQARLRRDAARAQLANGIDPSANRQEEKRSRSLALAPVPTFRSVAEIWMSRQDVSEATANKSRWIFTKFLYPDLGALPLREITSRVVLDCLRKIEGADMLETARRAKIRVGQVFRFAVIEGLTDVDPTQPLRGALKAPKVKHHAAIVDPVKIGGLLRAIDGFSGQFVTLCALQLAPLVFVRPGELRAAQWSEFDLDGHVWRIPGERMKMKAAHVVPLSKQAVSVLRKLHEFTGHGRYVFPSLRSAHRPMSENTINAALRRLGYSGEEMTGHGFRSLAATRLNEMGWNADAIERQLAHAESNKVRDAYTHAAQYLKERTKMMQAWSDYLDSLRAGGKVVAFKPQAGSAA
ncbi:tyrosine-type recombinase/integrase [Luteibacter flocculans]|uniref:Tyrosine-type recombinase/integrase n=1 Tax=Luteibacter flocculans TaxID=2780091 RepID=A0ABY4T8H5_9GAMM|nr:tyrosine-type recombinase/integrase [Luteibacter flocculans]URL59640.1 tyrosine-type recombinase/integrase [Luteibacter flocculans]